MTLLEWRGKPFLAVYRGGRQAENPYPEPPAIPADPVTEACRRAWEEGYAAGFAEAEPVSDAEEIPNA